MERVKQKSQEEANSGGKNDAELNNVLKQASIWEELSQKDCEPEDDTAIEHKVNKESEAKVVKEENITKKCEKFEKSPNLFELTK